MPVQTGRHLHYLAAELAVQSIDLRAQLVLSLLDLFGGPFDVDDILLEVNLQPVLVGHQILENEFK